MDNLNLPKSYVFKQKVSLINRGFAFLIDMFILDFLVLSMFSKSLSHLVPNLPYSELFLFIQANPHILNKLIYIISIAGGLIFAYFVYMQYNFKQTIGMHITKIYVKNIENKKELTLWQIMIRNVYLIPIFPFILLWIIEPVYLIFNKNRFTESLSKTMLQEEHKL